MSSYFPDLNVWLSLSDPSHIHSVRAWTWLNEIPRTSRLIFSRYTEIGLLRLLTTPAVMGEQVFTIEKAWRVYDRLLDDPRIELHPEPRGLDAAFRKATNPLAAMAASKSIGDCYLLAHAVQSQATLVTFDKGLHALAQKQGHLSLIPA